MSPPTIIPARTTSYPDSYWRSLHYFNLYRMTVAGVFVVSFAMFGTTLPFGAGNPSLFLAVSIAYVMFSVLAAITVSVRSPRFEMQLGTDIIADILFVTILMHLSGGIRSGLGLLLVVSLAATGMIGRGRLAMFYAALASIALLLEQSYRIATLGADSWGYFQSGLLSMGFFATAWLAHALAKHLVASEQVVRQRGVDIANLAHINQLVIQDMQDGVVVVDAKCRVRQCNVQAGKLLGAAQPKRGEISLSDYSPLLAERFRQWRDDPRANFEPLRVEATNRQIRTRFVPVGGEELLGAVIFLEDLSRIRAQAQQFKLAALGRLTANIAHEIRNPLSAISHGAELLQEERHLDDTQSRLLRIIHDNAQRIDRIVQDVLQLNRRDRIHIEALDSASFLRNFVEEFRLVEKIPGNVFAVEADAGRAFCFDRMHLHQVLWNLCRNAWRHCQQQNASIRLRVAPAAYPDMVYLDVVDDGPGVDRELQPQLFEPFFTTSSGGAGLGLYIAREICEANGAALEYVERARGAQFRVSCRSGPC